MLARDRGRIIQVGSALAYRGIPLQAAYCASKHAIQGFMDSLRCELIHDKSQVRVTMVQMPAMNTPQFDWIKSRLPKKAQPVPPIFQPDVAAEAIVYASHHDRREIYVGMPSVKAIIGNKLFPGLLDHYLAHTGYKGQQTDEPQDPNQATTFTNRCRKTTGQWAFDDCARNFSPQLWTDLHRDSLAAFALLGAAVLAASFFVTKNAD